MKNKNRLEREWEALCSYQAEPSTCGVAQGEHNSKRNRSDAVVACESARPSVLHQTRLSAGPEQDRRDEHFLTAALLGGSFS